MSFAISTAFLFAFSAICNTRVTQLMEAISANLARLTIASISLGIITFCFDPNSFHPEASAWLLFSGIVGFGIGDIALFMALFRIGSRLTILINFCVATIIGSFSDWVWLGDAIGSRECLSITLILGGLSVALLSGRAQKKWRGSFKIGLIAAIIAGIGQGMGASISRHADSIAIANGITIGGSSQAFQRVLAGCLFLLLVFSCKNLKKSGTNQLESRKKPLGWLFAAAMFGPVLGVSCFQASLKSMTSGEAMAIVSTSPLLLIPLAFIFENDRPTTQSVIGALFAISGVIAMALAQ